MKKLHIALLGLTLGIGASQTQAQPGPRGGDHPPRSGPPPLIALLDTDRDGVLSEAEIDRAAEALRSLDKNKDGKIEREEFGMRRPESEGRPPGGPGGVGRGEGRPPGPPARGEGPRFHGEGRPGPRFHGGGEDRGPRAEMRGRPGRGPEGEAREGRPGPGRHQDEAQRGPRRHHGPGEGHADRMERRGPREGFERGERPEARRQGPPEGRREEGRPGEFRRGPGPDGERGPRPGSPGQPPRPPAPERDAPQAE